VIAYGSSAYSWRLGWRALVELGDWSGLVRDRNDDFDALYVMAPEPTPAGPGHGGAFRATASDKRGYFVKSLQTCIRGEEASVAVEQIVAGLGRLIGAPVCHTSLIRIPSALEGWRPHTDRRRLEEGLAHASLALEHADDVAPDLTARTKDDNCRRHVGVYALYDWCFGMDPQWLHDLDNDRMTFSHDHGLYFPPLNRAGWTREELVSRVDEARELPDPREGLLSDEVKRVALAIEQVSRDALAEILCSVPASWPVSNAELQDLGWFLERRAVSVAARVRSLA
jgi:hypothetical protein